MISNIAEIHSRIDAALFAVGEVHKLPFDLFKQIGSACVDDVSAALGYRLGTHLHSLCRDWEDGHSVLNVSHPDLDEVVPSLLRNAILESLEIAKYCREKEYSVTRLNLHRVLKNELKDVEDRLMSLRACARLLQERISARSIKASQPIDLSNAYKKGQAIWESQPDNFDLFVRNTNLHKEEIEKYRKQADRFKQLGCESMCQEIMKSIDGFQRTFEDIHYGFWRITMTQTALIAAKMHGYSWDANHNNLFIQYDTKRRSDQLSHHDMLKEFDYIYCPLTYPAECLELSDRIKKIIDLLECFPEASGNPIFDYYIILVPVFTPVPCYSYHFELIAKGDITPVLLGEKDGKCYFISLW
jgi:hypothetical protein